MAFALERTLTFGPADAAVTDFRAKIPFSLIPGLQENIRSDAKDVAFFASDGTTPLSQYLIRQKIFGGKSSTSWFSRPVILYDAAGGTGGLTITGFVANAQIGAIEIGDQVLVAYDHATHAFLTPFILCTDTLTDDHNNPSTIKLGSGKYLSGWCDHNETDGGPRVRKSTNAGDISAWDSAVRVAGGAASGHVYSYCQLALLSSQGTGSGRVYCFYRYDNGSWAYKTSDDEGATWSAQIIVWDPLAAGVPYIIIYSNGVDRIDVLASRDVSNPVENEISHFSIFAASSSTVTLHKTDGTDITGSGPTLDETEVTSVYDGVVTGIDCWISDIRRDGVDLYAIIITYPVYATDHRYVHCKSTNGAAWVPNEIVQSDGPIDTGGASGGVYSGNAVFDGNNLNRIWACVKDGAPGHMLQLLETTDGGSTWGVIETCITGMTTDWSNYRPWSPLGYPVGSPIQVVCSSGPYIAFTTFPDVNNVCWPGVPAAAWVLIPSVSDSVDNVIKVKYSDAAYTTDLDVPNTVAGSTDRMWLDFNYLPGKIYYPDMTSNATIATRDGTTTQEPDTVVGSQMTGGMQMTGNATNGHATLGTPASLNMNVWTGITATAVVNLSSGGVSTAERVIFCNGTAGTTACLLLRVEPGSTPAHRVEGFVATTASFLGGEFAISVPTGQTSVVKLTYDGVLRCYVDGVAAGTTFNGAGATFKAVDSTAGFVGSQSASVDGFKDTLEHLRIGRNVAESAAYATLEADFILDFAGTVTVSGGVATAFNLSGPSSGNFGAASTNFTVTPNGDILASTIYTPNTSAIAGTFTPATLTFSIGPASGQTLTFTPTGGVGATDISGTNDGPQADPTPITYTVAAVVPGAPTAVSGSPGNTQISVNGTPPVFTGGAAITGYVADDGLGGHTTASGALPRVVTGLTNGTPYTVRLAAVNSAGQGAWGTAGSAVTPAVPVPGLAKWVMMRRR